MRFEKIEMPDRDERLRQKIEEEPDAERRVAMKTGGLESVEIIESGGLVVVREPDLQTGLYL